MSSFHSAAVKNVASTALPGAVAHDVVVEGPLVLGPLARPAERALEEPQAVDGERAALAQQRVPLARVQRVGACVWCSSVSAGACSPATFAWRRLAASPPRSSAAGTCSASDADERADVVERVVQRSASCARRRASSAPPGTCARFV